MRHRATYILVVAVCVTAAFGVAASASPHLAVPQPEVTPIVCTGVTWPVDVGVCIPPWDLAVEGGPAHSTSPAPQATVLCGGVNPYVVACI